MKHKKKSKESKSLKVQGKPENYFNLCQQQCSGTDLNAIQSEETYNIRPDAQSVLNYKNMIASKAIERERQNRSREGQLLGEKELPGVIQCLARVYDFQKCCMIEKAVEPTVKAVPVVVAQPEPPKLQEVPIVPPELETMKKPYPNIRGNSITLSEYNRRNQEQRLKSVEMPRHQVSSMIRQPSCIPSHVKETRGGNDPIIVVPSEQASMITLHNVQMLLQERRFIPPSLMRGKDPKRLEEVIIKRNYRGTEQRYRAIDNVSTLSRENWAKVVAVFVYSPYNQFIGWPFQGDPDAICRNVCAFHIHFRGHPIYRELEELNINMLRLHEIERNMDNEVLMDFWRKLDLYLNRANPQMGLQSGLK